MLRWLGKEQAHGHHQPLIFELQRKRPRDTHATLNPLSTEVQVADAVFFGKRDRLSLPLTLHVKRGAPSACRSCIMPPTTRSNSGALSAVFIRPALTKLRRINGARLCALPVSAEVNR